MNDLNFPRWIPSPEDASKLAGDLIQGASQLERTRGHYINKAIDGFPKALVVPPRSAIEIYVHLVDGRSIRVSPASAYDNIGRDVLVHVEGVSPD